MNITIDKQLQTIVRLGILEINQISTSQILDDQLWTAINQKCADLEAEHQNKTAGEIEHIQDMRLLYRAIGLDPTKTRPSSEALLRRAIKGKGLFRVHPLVDLFNLVSVATLFSIGLYDTSKLQGDTLTVRLGHSGENYEGIRRGTINVQDRLCIADTLGAFGSPTADSSRTSINGQVTSVLAIFFQSKQGEKKRLEKALQYADTQSQRFLETRSTHWHIIDAEV